MANDFYNASGAPATSANLTSATVRAEFTSIDDAFDKLPTMTANGDGCIFVNSAGTALVAKTAAQARTLLGLVIGTDVQAYDADLAAIAALSSAANKMPYSTGAQTWALADLTAAGRALMDDASAAAQRTTLGSTSVGDAVFTAASSAAAREAANVPLVNWLLNPDGEVAQALPASSADGDYDFDQWIALTQTGTVASTQTSNPEDGYRYGMRMTQSQASAQRMGRIQIIEGKDAIKLRGKAVTYGGRRRLSSSANIRMAIVEWTGTEDSAVKDVVNDWTSSTYTTGNFFKSTTTTVVATAQVAMTANTARDCSVSGTISSSATNILVFEWTESTVAQNVTFDAWGSRLIEASSLIDYIRRLYADELRLCQRHFYSKLADGDNNERFGLGLASDSTHIQSLVWFPTQMRSASYSLTISAAGDFSAYSGASSFTISAIGVAERSINCCNVSATCSTITAGTVAYLTKNGTASARMSFSARIGV